MNTRLATFLSVILHPLLMPTVLFMILFFLAPVSLGLEGLEPMFRWIVIGFVFIYTFAIPAYLIYLLNRWGFISSLQLENLQERRLPYLLTALIYGLLGYFLYSKNSSLFACAYILWSITIVILCVALISFRWQISAHGAGIGGVIGALAGIMVKMGENALFMPLLFCMILAGYVLGARLQLNAHTPKQAWAGLFLGVGLSLLAVSYFF
ncbi:hypothetical protein [Emticicia sp. 21SJ11W-3]|uniref:hypothetical protein n=1 Tax=Emticicia sp. 21SJ11W-3 TaxID=2916755 RepID=UPI00209E3A4F|nr:hypothetical protein [Emticicia sp. 21SJ11W-3]UTA68618.1 hypothetical protein MB380_02145 [Emticicia sp. 21SJ11W-3]